MLDARLVVVQGKPIGKEIPLRVPKLLVGRGAECHLRPASELVSRQHCVFILKEDALILRDLGSTNGTFVNGHRITGEVVLMHGDTVQIGPLGFRVVLRTAAPAGGKPARPAAAARLGAQETDEDSVTKWLLDEAEPSSSVGDMPTTMVGASGERSSEDTVAERAELQETQLNVPVPGVGAPAEGEGLAPKEAAGKSEEDEEEEKVVVVEGGLKIKLKGKKQKIEKTREDTSRAADEILKRMLERRPR